jgi:hypothetical protein
LGVAQADRACQEDGKRRPRSLQNRLRTSGGYFGTVDGASDKKKGAWRFLASRQILQKLKAAASRPLFCKGFLRSSDLQ